MKIYLRGRIRPSQKTGFAISLVSLVIFLLLGPIITPNQAATVLSDNFDDGVTDTSKWRVGILSNDPTKFNNQMTVAELAGRLTVIPRSLNVNSSYSGYVSSQMWDLTNGSVVVQVVQRSVNNGETIFAIGIDSRNYYRFRGRGNTIYLESSVNGRTTSKAVSSTTTAARYWRFRHVPSSDRILFESSADSVSWTQNGFDTRSIAITHSFIELGAGTSTSVSSPGSALFDNFRLDQASAGSTPTPTPAITATATATPTATPNPSLTPTPIQTITPTPNPTVTPPPPPGNANSRGYLTTPSELAQVKSKSQQGIEPYRTAVNSLLSTAGSSTNWPYGIVDPVNRDLLNAASALVYAKSLAYHLTGDEAYAASARQKILEMSTMATCPNTYSGNNGCILTLSRHISAYVAAADLIESSPSWSAQDKAVFQGWLSEKVYRFTDWASDTRSTNWGTVGTKTTLYIADYFAHSNRNLIDRNGSQVSAHNAYVEARQRAFDRNNGNSYMYNSVCSDTTGLGIKYHGGIPEEIGRGSTGCLGTYLLDDDSSWSYMVAALSGTLPTAELLLRRGDPTLYNNLNSSGGGSILRAILFVIENPYAPSGHSFDWISSRKSILEIAYRYYRHPAMARQLGVGTSSRHIAGSGNTAMPHFGTLTHGFATNENPGTPPVVAAP